MKPPYELTPPVIKLITSISEKIGEVKASFVDKPSPQLRKQNKVKTIHSSLKIEGNTLTEDQITALIENKRVLGPKKDIIEVKNAIKVYDQIQSFIPFSEKSFLSAHKILMEDLVKKPGFYRNDNVGIIQGNKVAHLAPPALRVPHLMQDLFSYLKNEDEITLIKSCVFHYEVEFIHPFIDGNGRMGRLWQTVILMSEYPVFEFLSFETLINKEQEKYYEALSKSDKSGSSTPFIQYILEVIQTSLDDLLDFKEHSLTAEDRLEYFISLNIKEFTRSDYMKVFKDISSSTASRDLNKGINLNMFEKKGDKRLSKYYLNKN